jgi:hypothetical protein
MMIFLFAGIFSTEELWIYLGALFLHRNVQDSVPHFFREYYNVLSALTVVQRTWRECWKNEKAFAFGQWLEYFLYLETVAWMISGEHLITFWEQLNCLKSQLPCSGEECSKFRERSFYVQRTVFTGRTKKLFKRKRKMHIGGSKMKMKERFSSNRWNRYFAYIQYAFLGVSILAWRLNRIPLYSWYRKYDR